MPTRLAETSTSWWKLASTMPCGSSTADRKSRKAMFRSMDDNGNGLLTFTEVERFMRKLLGAEQAGALMAMCLLRGRIGSR